MNLTVAVEGYNAIHNSTNATTTATVNDSLPGRNSSGSQWGRWSSGPDPPNIPMIAFLVVCICVSTFGNGAVLYIAALKIKRSSFGRLNLLISSLALSDFLQTFSLMIPQLFKNIYGEWGCGILICKIHSSLRSTQTNISISILTLITLERFLYLDKLSDGSENKNLYIVINFVVWSVHVALAVPLGIWHTVVGVPRQCTIPINTIAMTEEYLIVTKTTFFFVPLVIMWICNIGIIYKTRKSALSVRPLQVNRQPQNTPAYNSRVDRERRTILTCLILAVVFTVTNLPFETCLFFLKSSSNRQQISKLLQMMSYFWPLTILNACINPFIYSVFFKEFRQRIKEMMRCSKCPECSNIICCKGSTPTNNSPPTSNRTEQTIVYALSERRCSNISRNDNSPGPAQAISLSSCDVSVPSRPRDHTHFMIVKNKTLKPISIEA